MENTRLVQRLCKPYTGPLAPLANAFAFGGGLRNGGLSDDAMGLLRNIFSFDYMGAAEFEFGAVPKALQTIAKSAKNLEAFTISMPLSKVAANWKEKRSTKAKPVKPESRAEIFVIAPKDWRKEVTERIVEWAGKDYNPDLKESTRLHNALRPVEDYDKENAGWLELNNGFFFFVDRDMFKATAELFGVKVGEDGSVERIEA